jgi:hypothetical protein
MRAGIALDRGAKLAGDGGVARRREEFQVPLLEHHAAIACTGGHDGSAGLGAMRLLGERGQRETELFQRAARTVHVRHEVRHVIEHQLSRRRNLTIGRSGIRVHLRLSRSNVPFSGRVADL